MRNYEQETVIPFAPAAKSAGSNDADQLDTAGRTILSLLNKAASVADENSQHALDMAQKLSHQLRAAENRIAELEADVRYYQDRCERADQWLHKIFSEIEERFLKPGDKRRAGVLPFRSQISFKHSRVSRRHGVPRLKKSKQASSQICPIMQR